MYDTSGIISTAVALQELGIIGILGLSNIAWIWIAKRLWEDRNKKERELYDCLKWKRSSE